MELFGGAKGPSKGKFSFIYHKKPSTLTPNEGAAVLSMGAHMADLEKLGVDPTKVHLILQFKETGHEMCVNLSREGGGAIGMGACGN